MNYLIPTFDCFIFHKENFSLKANVKYKISNMTEDFGIVLSEKTIPFVLNFNKPCENVLKVNCGYDNYYFLFAQKFCSSFLTKIQFKSQDVVISLSNKLFITVDGMLICEKDVDNIKYSHFETIGDLCVIYFTGKRNYIVVLKDKELCFASDYDECNENEKEKYFMCKLKDSLNHGLVCHIKDNVFDSYLVYLDDEELMLKEEFVPFVFLDCVKAKNYKYCNELLDEDLKMETENQIATFFPEFDYYYPLNNEEFVLINKNTLAGIYAFSIKSNKITNIMNR